jgi:GT2 family glycosyltransferase
VAAAYETRGLELPAVSVVIPTYRRRELVRRAVASVLAQTHQDFELIVVDGSDDGTREALSGLDERIRYHRERKPGVARARNAALRLARAPVVAFLDSDNRWLPHHLACVTQALARHPDAVLATTCPRFRIAGREGPEQARLIHALPRLLLTNHVGYMSCAAVRREALDAVGGFDEELIVGEDHDVYLRLAMLGPFCAVRRRSIEHQATSGGLSERGRRQGAYLEAYERSVARMLDELERLPRRDTPELVQWARASMSLLTAIRALQRRDEGAARIDLAEACALVPRLSHDPPLVLGRLKYSARNQDELHRLVSSAARLWPDPRSDTALYLRSYAAVDALRAGRPRDAGRLLAHRSLFVRPGFVVRTLPATERLVRAWLLGLVHRGREPADLDARADVPHDHGTHGDDRGGADRDVVADDGRHPDERIGSDANVAGHVRSRANRGEVADLGVVAGEDAAADDDVLADRGVRADDDPGAGDRPDPDGARAGKVRPRMEERRDLPAGRQEAADDGPPG